MPKRKEAFVTRGTRSSRGLDAAVPEAGTTGPTEKGGGREQEPGSRGRLTVDDVSSISKEKDVWRVIVKVVRKWMTPSFDRSKLPNSMELVLMDAKGDRIHDIVQRTHVYKFNPLLVEGQVYMLSHFSVGDSPLDFRTMTHAHRIIFGFDSVVQTLTDVPITKSPYSFVSVYDIMFNDPDQTLLADVIEILTGHSGEQEFEKNHQVRKRITIEIEQEGVKVECAFFGSYVQELLSVLSSRDLTGVVVLIQFAKIKLFRGQQILQNPYGATRIVFNIEISEATVVRDKFFKMNEPGSQILTQLSGSSKPSLDEEFLKLSEMKTFEQIRAMDEKSCCVVLGTIIQIPEGDNWWYKACKCNKKVIWDEKMYICDNFKVKQGNNIATLVIFDKEASALLETTCADFVDSSTKNPAGSGSTTPAELLKLLEKTILFTIEVSNTSSSRFEPSYRVKKICADPDLIAQFKEALPPPNDDTAPLLLLETPTSDENVENASSSLAKNLNEEFVIAASGDVVDLVTNNVVDPNIEKEEVPPCKRSTHSENEGVGSTNNKKKLIKKIKKEKN
ncbi:replication protein A 70 kDa DNA-binding subunit C-like [Lotus japonicus]|uniref:replication protein A 70 kDa DNA-binding subunit C-like n=1 Tax=Lotus japonicus TaxID=34305 RepID=UPI002584C054|nr:replication protein A 70 kDa DNA-binding subunit C-like [Lotus japonicus]